MSIRVVGPNEGEQTGGGPIRCRIIEDGSHTQHRLGLYEAFVPPGPGGPPQHVHHQHDETFIVTEGTLRFTSGADSVITERGQSLSGGQRARREPRPFQGGAYPFFSQRPRGSCCQ